MEKEFVSHELALILKALGFKERVLTYYEDGKPKLHTAIEGWDFNSSFLTCVSRPTYSQAFRWFREKHGLSAIVSQFGYSIENSFGGIEYYIDEDENPTCYEEAELACLEKLIELVEQKEK